MNRSEVDDLPPAPEPETGDQGQERPSVGLEAVEASRSDSQDVEGLRRERDALREQLLRRRAEFENFRRRTERERESWTIDAQAELLTELIPTLDHLEQALKTGGGSESLHEGIALIHRDLLATLNRLGLEVHAPTGRGFDPSREHALSREMVEGLEAGTVIETYRPGFVFKDRLLRPALVKVAADNDGETLSDEPPASESGPEEVD
jgi:molecular chaperone GrpE